MSKILSKQDWSSELECSCTTVYKAFPNDVKKAKFIIDKIQGRFFTENIYGTRFFTRCPNCRRSNFIEKELLPKWLIAKVCDEDSFYG